MPETDSRLLPIFETIMRAPESRRGLAVDETCHLLAKAAREHSKPLGYKYPQMLTSLETMYIEAFLHTCSIIPDFAEQIRKGIARHR